MSHGLTRLWPTVGFAVCALISFGLLTLALKTSRGGRGLCVWTGTGAAVAAAVGISSLVTPCPPSKIVSIGLILCGVIGLNLSA